jgi:hypothetical protein
LSSVNHRRPGSSRSEGLAQRVTPDNEETLVTEGLVPGVALGILIGVTSGVVALVLLKTANTASVKDVSSIVALTSEILAIPTFWFGGPFVSTKLFGMLSLDAIINPYIVSLAISFVLLVVYPIFRWVAQLGAELGRTGGTKNA